MPISRRNLLRLGAGAAFASAATSCADTGTDAGHAHREPATRARTSPQPSTVPPRPSAPAREFPGRPPAGRLYYGASLPADRSLVEWERALGTRLALHRSYFTPEPGESARMLLQCHDDLARGRLPHVSMKPPVTWAEVAAGGSDPWLTGLLRLLDRPRRPIFFTLHHEPENDAGGPGMQPADFVAMQHRLIDLAGRLAPQVTVVPVLQHWTFEPLHVGSDPRAWLVPEAVVMGVDVYNPWSPTNGKPWRTFGSRVDEVVRWLGDTPLAIGEYGCRQDPADPAGVAAWLRDAADYARSHNIVSMSYFNSGVNSPEGTTELHGAAEQTFAELLASRWVARPA
jgi:hypothetical protein